MENAVYNEIEPFLAKWLDNLISAGMINDGHIVCKSIVDVNPPILNEYEQVHLFAGIGGWSCALRLSGWPDTRNVWTISCPCPPWSRARIQNLDMAGIRDTRDLWPTAFELIKKNKPREIYGEQVAGKAAEEWVFRTRENLEEVGYNFIGRTTKSSCVGAPSQRERFFFFAYLDGKRRSGLVPSTNSGQTRPWRWSSQKDLCAIAESPFESTDCWAQPLLRKGDDGVSNRVAVLRAYGNAIDPWQASKFITETQAGIGGGFFK